MSRNIQTFYNQGEHYYSLSLQDKALNSAFAGLAGGAFWCAFVLGHPQAAYPLALCFLEGRGVRKDAHIGKLFFGVALGLNDERCTELADTIIVPKNMDDEVRYLLDAFKRTQDSFHDQMQSNADIDQPTLDRQFNHFRNYFAVDEGNIVDYFHQGEAPAENVALTGAGADDDSCCCTLF
jgi:hypothetical protein